MKLLVRSTVCALLFTAPAAAQSLPAYEIVAGPSRIAANGGAWGAHAGAGIRFPASKQFSLSGILFYAPARGDSMTPAIRSAELEFSTALGTVYAVPHFNVFLSIGFTLTHFDARLQQAVIADCTPENFCMLEGGVWYRTGTRGMWSPGIALEFPMGRNFVFRPHARAFLPQADDAPGAHAFGRLDFSMKWQH